MTDTTNTDGAAIANGNVSGPGVSAFGPGIAVTKAHANAEKAFDKAQEQTLTQADVDRIVQERVARERAKFSDYDELRAKAEGARTLEERFADLEKQNAQLSRDRLVARVQVKHGISDEDASLFLTGTDEDTLTAQAKRLAERESDRKKHGNLAPREGATTNHGDANSDMREFTKSLFNTAD